MRKDAELQGSPWSDDQVEAMHEFTQVLDRAANLIGDAKVMLANLNPNSALTSVDTSLDLLVAAANSLRNELP